MNIRSVRQHLAIFCITMILAAAAQPVLAGNVLPPLEPLCETELNLLDEPGQTEKLASIVGLIHRGGPYTIRSFNLTVPHEDGGTEYLVASYAWEEGQEEVQVMINAGGRIYTYIDFIDSPQAAEGFIGRYIDLYQQSLSGGAEGTPVGPGKPGGTVADHMMGFFTWLDAHLLETEGREYGFAQKFAWMRSETYQRFAPHAAKLLRQVVYADSSAVDNGWVKAITIQDMAVAFGFPVMRVLEGDPPVPAYNEMESFSIDLVALESNQPAGGWDDWFSWLDDYYDCWNSTWSFPQCHSCCQGWFANMTAICIIVGGFNPPLGVACELSAATGYLYCVINCGLANPSLGGGWAGGD